MLCCGAWRTGYAADFVCLVVQVGDGSTTNRYTPVAVVGLSSGVAMVALGGVRLFFCCWFGVGFSASGDGTLRLRVLL